MRIGVALAAAAASGSMACAPAPSPRDPAAEVPERSASASSTPRPAAPAEPVSADQTDVPPDFARDVQPVLAQRCDPCHVPGGKMYERLPFDDPETVASHPEGILRRLKGDDRAIVERWIASRAARP